MSKQDEQQQMTDFASNKLFKSLFICVLITVLFYIPFFLFCRAERSALAFLVGLIVFGPLTMRLELRGNKDWARLVFVVSCNYYIFFASLGLSHLVNAEYYCLPSMMLGILLFDNKKWPALLFGVLTPLLTWLLIAEKVNFYSIGKAAQPDIPYQLISKTNFIGSSLIVSVFLVLFIRIMKAKEEHKLNLVFQSKIDQELLAKERIKLLHATKLAAIGEISAGFAHEINNPLGTIILSLSLLRSARGSDEQYNSTLASMERSSQRMSQIVRSLKRFSHSSELAPTKPQRIAPMVIETKTLCELRASQLHVPITVDLASEAEVLCNEGEIIQVLLNLVNNAVDAAKTSDEKWVRISLRDENSEVVIQVINSGPKISPEVAKKLFEAFFTTKSSDEGTGLGLSISKRLLDQHHASIFVNQDCENTCFEVRFTVSTTSGPVEAGRC